MGNNLKLITLLLGNNSVEHTFLLGNPTFKIVLLLLLLKLGRKYCMYCVVFRVFLLPLQTKHQEQSLLADSPTEQAAIAVRNESRFDFL